VTTLSTLLSFLLVASVPNACQLVLKVSLISVSVKSLSKAFNLVCQSCNVSGISCGVSPNSFLRAFQVATSNSFNFTFLSYHW
ncbi:5473_t:CDS:1, partial [Funneliformis geosporum]